MKWTEQKGEGQELNPAERQWVRCHKRRIWAYEESILANKRWTICQVWMNQLGVDSNCSCQAECMFKRPSLWRRVVWSKVSKAADISRAASDLSRINGIHDVVSQFEQSCFCRMERLICRLKGRPLRGEKLGEMERWGRRRVKAKRSNILPMVFKLIYTEHCSVWSYQFYWYYSQYLRRRDEKGRFLRWPDVAIRKILFIYLFFVNLIYIIFN